MEIKAEEYLKTKEFQVIIDGEKISVVCSHSALIAIKYKQGSEISTSKLAEREQAAYARGLEDGYEEGIKFGEYIVNSNWIQSSNDLWYFKSDGNPDTGITTEELFKKFHIGNL